MTKNEKGAVSGIALGIFVVVLLAIVGIGWMWKRGGVVATNTTSNATSTSTGIPNTGETGYSYVIGESATTTQVAASEPKTVTRTYTTYVKKTVPNTQASAYTGSVGTGSNVYHDSTYGLTLRLPQAGYRTYMTAGGPAGLPGTAQIHFIAPGSSTDTFVINVWSKAQWNAIRTEENFVHQNTTSLGEGTYLGENFTWIYSYQVYYDAPLVGQALSGAVFY